METIEITLSKSTLVNLLTWFEKSDKNNFHGKYFPFEHKPHVFTTRKKLLEELKKRETNVKELSSFKLIQLLNEYSYEDEDDNGFFWADVKRIKRKKNEFIYNYKYLFRLKTITSELNRRRLNLSKVNTKQLLSWYKKYRLVEGLFNIDYSNDYTLIYAKELKKELDKREHINDNKSLNKSIRKMCAKHNINKAEALKLIKETK